MPTSSAPALQPLVLLPGLLCDSLLYASQIAGLASVADCWVPAPTGHDSIESMARQVLADCPFERFSLAGLSMGGYVAQEIVHQAPQRVERLALLDTNALADTPEGSAGRRALLELAQARGLAPVVDALLPRLVWPHAPAATRLHAIVLAMARNVGPAAFVRQQAAIMARRDRRDDLARIACPTLVACGMAPVQPASVQRPPFWRVLLAVKLPGVGLTLSSAGYAMLVVFITLLFAQRGWGGAALAFTCLGAGFIAARLLFGHLPDKLGGARHVPACGSRRV